MQTGDWQGHAVLPGDPSTDPSCPARLHARGLQGMPTTCAGTLILGGRGGCRGSRGPYPSRLPRRFVTGGLYPGPTWEARAHLTFDPWHCPHASLAGVHLPPAGVAPHVSCQRGQTHAPTTPPAAARLLTFAHHTACLPPQGDAEKASGLPVSPLFDRDKPGVTKSQVRLRQVAAFVTISGDSRV